MLGNMNHLQARRISALHLAVIVAMVIALGGSLATRTFHLSSPRDYTSAHSDSSSAKHQHLDSDGIEFAPPVLRNIVLQVVSFYPRVAPAGPPLPGLLFDKSLYNRPPPSC
jgi:hypothetical protein